VADCVLIFVVILIGRTMFCFDIDDEAFQSETWKFFPMFSL
jgi:hypothetical protein